MDATGSDVTQLGAEGAVRLTLSFGFPHDRSALSDWDGAQELVVGAGKRGDPTPPWAIGANVAPALAFPFTRAPSSCDIRGNTQAAFRPGKAPSLPDRLPGNIFEGFMALKLQIEVIE